MARYFETARSVIERHGGTVEKFIGDAVMAVFGVPAVHEDDALRAVRAADELGRALRTLDAELASSGVALGVRIGVETGEVVAGVGRPETTLVTGDAVNVAARLEQAAGAGEVLLGPGTLELVRQAVVVESLEPLALKGKTEPVRAFRLTSVTAGVAGRDAPRRRADGRSRARARRPPRGVRSGRRRIGPPSCSRCSARPASARAASSREFAGGRRRRRRSVVSRSLPALRRGHHLLADCRDRPGGRRDRTTTTAPRSPAPGSTAFFGDAPERRLDRPADRPGRRPGRRAGDAGRALLGRPEVPRDARPATGPLVVVVEDVHWAEPTLLDLIDDIVERSRGASILLVAVRQAGPPRASPRVGRPARRRGRSSSSGCRPRRATGSSPACCRAPICRTRCGTRLEEAAEGNPLFAEELVGMLVDDGHAASAVGGGWVSTAAWSGCGSRRRSPPS